MNLLVGAVSMGLVLSLLGLGVFISWKVLDTFDLTADGAFGLGAVAAAALLVAGAPSWVASPLAALAGAVAGAATGLIHTRLKVSALLSGLLVTTALYSVSLMLMRGGDLPLAGTRTLPAEAFQAWMALGGPAQGVTVGGVEVSARSLATLLAVLPAVGLSVLLVERFFRTQLGLALRATGDNRQMARAIGIDVDLMTVLALAFSNALIAGSGAFFAQYQGFANIQMSVGMLMMGLAAVALGDAVLRTRVLGRRIASVVFGSVLLRLLVAVALAAGLPANLLKLALAALVLAVLVVPDALGRALRGAEQARG
jgi:putative ABC transport system permease protein